MYLATSTYGDLEGIKENDIVYFKGIPYAQAPVGELRFRSPQKPKAWEGVRDASKLGYACPQNKGIIAMVDETNEDCLYLNVATPAVDNKKRPVMVWIHGGSFTSGSGEQSVYLKGPLPLMGDVVLVTINYRLGVLGFVNFHSLSRDDAFESNLGLRDMIAALEWVRDNIANFGGNPNNVTVFGESAGAMGVSCLLGSPLAQGLFHKAIAQSGAAHMTTLPDDAKRVAKAFLDEAGIDIENLDKLKELEVEKLLKLQEKIAGIKFSNENRPQRLPVSSFAFIPTIGDDVLPEDPLIAIEKGIAKDVALLVGTNLHEWSFFVQLSDPGKNHLDNEALLKVISSRVPGMAEEAVECYYEDERAKPVDVFSAIESDRFFRIPAIRLLEAQGRHQENCYAYLFTFESTLLDGKLGSCHAVEIPFVFGSVDDNFTKLFVGQSPDIKALSDICVDAWTQFAKTGSPQCASLEVWPHYELDNRSTMELGKVCALHSDPMKKQREFWKDLL